MAEIKEKEENEYIIPEQENKRLALAIGFMAFPCAILREFILKWDFYNINPSSSRKSKQYFSTMALEKSGENLAAILHEIDLFNKEKGLKDIIAGLRGNVPGFKDIMPSRSSINGAWTFQIMEERMTEFINPSSVSDGTIRLLVFYVIAMWAAQKGSLIMIEEPENGLHPHLAEPIVQLFREASEDWGAQFLITTHNPLFLEYLEPDEIIVVDKIDGITKTKKAYEIADFETHRKYFGLGELWKQGALGGIP